MKRRHLGAAHERSPYDSLNEWSGRNLLTFGAAVIGFFGWVLVVIVGTNVLNFVASDGSEESLPPYDHDSLLGVVIKVLGGLIVAGVITLVKGK